MRNCNGLAPALAILLICPRADSIAPVILHRAPCRLAPLVDREPLRIKGAGKRTNCRQSSRCSEPLSAAFFGSVDTFTSLEIAARSSAADAAALKEAAEAAVGTLGRDLLVFLSASVAVVPLSRYFGVTSVLGFLLAGFLLGPHGLKAFSNTEADLQLGDFGILFLLFSEGLNLSPEKLRDLGAFYGLGVLQMLFSMALFFSLILLGGPLVLQFVAPVIGMDQELMQLFGSPVTAFCIAAAGALSSSAFVLPVLKEKGWEERPEGIAALSVLLLQDLAVAPLLVVVPLVAGAGPQSSAELGVLAAKATVGFGAVLAVGSVLLRYFFEAVAAARSTETFVAAALLVALGMGQAADYLGLSATTGAFAAGVLLAGNRYRAQIKADIRPFEGILLGIFFLTAGASLDPSVLLKNLPTLLIGMTVFIVSKALILYIAGPALGKTRAQAARVAITLAGGGEFSLVLLNLAKELHVLPDKIFKLLAASVIISMSLTPLLGELADAAGKSLESVDGRAKFSRRGALTVSDAQGLFDEIDMDGDGTIDFQELRKAMKDRGLSYVSIAELFVAFDTDSDGTISRTEWLTGFEQGVLTSALAVSPDKVVPDLESVAETSAGEETSFNIASDAIVVCGYTEFGKEMYGVLEAAGEAENGGVVAFDLNPSRVAAGLLSGATVVYGDGSSHDLLLAAGVGEPRAVIIAYRSEARRMEATSRLREALPQGTPIYARVVSGQSMGREELLDAGATDVVSERTEASLRFGALLGLFDDSTPNASEELLRQKLTKIAMGTTEPPTKGPVPGIPEDRLNDLADEFNCTRRDLVRLYNVFSSLPDVNGDEFVEIAQLRDVLLRAGDGPIDDQTLEKWMEVADGERGGALSFVDFARAYFSQTGVIANK